jgi:uncharacterized protein (DUF885 family)
LKVEATSLTRGSTLNAHRATINAQRERGLQLFLVAIGGRRVVLSAAHKIASSKKLYNKMIPMKQWLARWFGVAVALVGLPLGPVAQEPSDAVSKRLHALFEQEWDRTMEENPTWASSLGDRRWNDRWPEVSPEAFARRNHGDQQALERLREIDRDQLSPADQLNYDLFEKRHATLIEEHAYKWHLIPLNQRGGIQTANELADALRFDTVQDYLDWVVRLRRFPTYMDQTIMLMREGMRQRVLLPAIIMGRIPPQIKTQLVAHPEESPFYQPFNNFTPAIPPKEQVRLRQAARAAIQEQILPAYEKFHRFFNEEYLPACYDRVGIWALPEGKEMYAFLAREFTTTKLTPEQIHKLGLKEVERIRGEMLGIKRSLGFAGNLHEFFDHLRTAPQFFYGSPEELLKGYRAMSREIDPHMVRLFRTLPRMPYGVEPIPEAIAPDTTTAYYRPPAADGSRAGTYFVNLYRPETRPKWEMMALSLHEAVPGHHLQIALAMELGELPQFRRYTGYTAYVEGWALYAEHLGEELGLYDDPYSKFGQLTYEMWRAVRLVVDTGIHALRWDREKAIEFFKNNAPKAENDIINEIDRYIAWPGQALAYKIGELKIKELRARAEHALGERFDIKEFHDVVLLSGAIPLDMLESKVDEWIRGK